MAPWALQTYTIRGELHLPQEALQRVCGYGFTALEVHDAAALAPLLTGSDLDVVGVHVDLTDPDGARAAWEVAEKLGTTSVIQPWVPPETWQDVERVTRLAEQLSAAALGAPEGYRVLYHNHDFEFAAPGLWEHFWEVADSAVGAELDVFWAARAGRLSPDILPTERVFSLHIKDGPLEGDPFDQTPLGAGQVDLDVALDAFPAAQRILEFDAVVGDVWTAIDRSLPFIEGWSM